MTASLPRAVHDVFERFLTTELTTIDRNGRPITWPVTPFYTPGAATIDVTTGIGWPKKARDAAANPHVALLFSDPTGSGIDRPPIVLVQGTVEVDDRDLDANGRRYAIDHTRKLRGAEADAPPESVQRRFDWYYARIYLRVRPERVLIWRDGDPGGEPELLEDTGTEDPPERRPASAPDPAPPRWDRRIEQLGRRHPTAVLSFVTADGFPFSLRVPMSVERRRRLIRIDAALPPGVPLCVGPACVTAHDHDESLRWQRNFQVRGDLLEHPEGGWAVVPQRVVHGFELPPVGPITRAISNFSRIRRLRRVARRERARRAEGPER